jgi:hypothetical protein
MSDCQYCVHDHAPAEGYPGRCPFYGSAKAWEPERPPPSSAEQRHAWAMREIELRQAEEHRVTREEAARRERQWATRRALLREYIAQQRQAALATAREAYAQGRAEAQADLEAQATAQRLARKVERWAQERKGRRDEA